MSLQVAAAVIQDGDKIMIARRSPDKHLGGLWEFPGGKIEEGEKPEETLVRELQEEFGALTEIGDYIMTVNHTYPTVTIDLHTFFAKIVGGEFRLIDHDQVAYVKVDELQNYQLAPADIPIMQKLKEMQSVSKG